MLVKLKESSEKAQKMC